MIALSTLETPLLLVVWAIAVEKENASATAENMTFSIGVSEGLTISIGK